MKKILILSAWLMLATSSSSYAEEAKPEQKTLYQIAQEQVEQQADIMTRSEKLLKKQEDLTIEYEKQLVMSNKQFLQAKQIRGA